MDARQRYQIVGRIAAGGMAEIYLARTKSNTGVTREIVLKRLLPELQGDKEFVQMFHDEARIAAQLNHPGIVQIFELGELDGSLFIAMELLRGVNLRDLLARCFATHRPLPTAQVVRIACSCLEALGYAHSFSDSRGKKLNVVHRDVSPQNILVTYEGIVKLVDFGVAKAEGRLHQTAAGMVKGKFAYMAPEQITGGKVDGRADLFALAEVVYEILLRRHPFYAPTDVQVLRAIIEKDPPHPSDVDPNFPRALGDILMRALQKPRDKRWTNAAEMHEALEEFLVESRAPATAVTLGRFVREVFGDRIKAEQFARENGDDAALIEVLTAGQAESVAMLDGDGVKLMHARRSSRAEPVQTIAGSELEEQTEGGRHGLASAVNEVTDRSAIPKRRNASIENDDNLPTMMGELSPEERAELFPSMSAPSVPKVDPIPVARDPGKPRSSVAPPARASVAPPARPSVAPTAKVVRGQPSVPPPPPDDRGKAEDQARAKARVAAAVETKPMPVSEETSRAAERAVVTETNAVPAPSGRMGKIVLSAGLAALISAIGVAGYVLSRPPATYRLVVESDPLGASVRLDGQPVGLAEPLQLEVARDKSHEVVVELEGHAPFTTTLDPTSEKEKTLKVRLSAASP